MSHDQSERMETGHQQPGDDAPVVLWVDRKDVITRVNPQWDLFARSNEGEAILSHKVIGTPILDWVTGDEARMLVTVMLDYVRLTGSSIDRQYRCDSPGLKRFMALHASPDDAHGVRMEHRMIRSEPLVPAVPFHEADDNQPHLETLRCSACNRLRFRGAWIDPGDIRPDEFSRLAVPHASLDRSLPVRHVVCPICEHELTRDLGPSR